MPKSRQETMVAECPSCDTSIRFHKQPRMGQMLTCPECEEALEVRRLNPITLDWAEDGYIDDEDEDDDRVDRRRRVEVEEWESEWISDDL